MYLFEIPPVPFQPPWQMSLSRRLSVLAEGSRHVAYFYPQPDNSTFRYRVWNMIEALGHTPDVGASWFSADDLRHLDAIIAAADVIVLCRCKYSAPFANLLTRARAAGKRVLFDIDDLVFDTGYVHMVLDHLGHTTTEADFDYWFADYGRYGALLRLCDGAILTNDFLADRVREFAGLPTSVVPNFMNAAQLRISDAILTAKRATGFRRNQHIHVGYFSGSPTHQRDFELIAPALSALMHTDPRIVLRVVGQLDIDTMRRRFQNRVEVFPLQNPLNLQRLVGEVEINLVPLQDNVFTNAKSELKFFEAAAVGTVTVASPTFTLTRAIEDGRTGFLAAAHQWRAALTKAIHDVEDGAPVARAAADAVLSHYVPANQNAGVRHAVLQCGAPGLR